MAELKETPSNAAMMAVVKALRSARERVRPTSEGVLPSVGRFATDMVLPEGGIDELENWAYGNAPMHVPEMSGIPQFKGDAKGLRGGRALEATSMLPIATALKGAGQAGLIIPIIKGLNKSPKKDDDLIRTARMAEQLRDRGASFKDIWHDLQVSPVPRTKRMDPESGRWAHEVEFTPEMLRSQHLLTENEKLERAANQFPADWGDYFSGADMTPELRNATERPYMREGSYKINELVDNDELFDQYPALAKLDVNIHDTSAGTMLGRKSGGGGFTPPSIDVWQPGTALHSDPQHSPFGVLTHELQHGVQDAYNMPSGGSADMMRLSFGERDKMVRMVEHLRNSGTFQGDPQLEFALKQLEKNVQVDPFKRYLNLMGEQQARAQATRANLPKETRTEHSPLAHWSDADQALEPAVWNFGQAAATRQALNTDEERANWLSTILRGLYKTNP